MMLVKKRWLKGLFFLVAIGLFLVHPEGGSAWVYSCLWLIPLVALLVKNGSLIEQALTSTFAAHSVGSLIYLYSGLLTSQQWIALAPVALCERLVFATGIATTIYVIDVVRAKYSRWSMATI
jgi:uncharacterized membrane protein